MKKIYFYYLSHRTLVSGYQAKFRLEVIKAAVTGYERKVFQAENGGQPLYRPRGYKPEERRRKKLMSRTSLFRPADTAKLIINNKFLDELRHFQHSEDINVQPRERLVNSVEVGQDG